MYIYHLYNVDSTSYMILQHAIKSKPNSLILNIFDTKTIKHKTFSNFLCSVLVLREDEVQPVPGGGSVGVHAGGGRGATAKGVGLEAGQPAAAHQGAARVARAHHARLDCG